MVQTSSTPIDNRIEITMFGEFSIRAGESQVKDSLARTHQLWHLLEYLITLRHKAVSQDELIGMLWPEEDIDNPSNALKNLVYRVRSMLDSNGLPRSKEMIVYSKGSYRWNNELPCTVDTEEFDAAFRLATSPGQSLEQRVKYYFKVLDIYRGDFLVGARFETWVVPIASQYRSQYFRCVYELLEIMIEQRNYAAMEDVCQRAIKIDQFEEAAHRYLILALIRQGKQAQAMSHYGAVTDLFFRELGVSPSSSMRALYREIVKTIHDVEIDLGIIKEDLEESERSDGAFFCEYEVFKNLYRLEARAAARNGQSVYISLITIEEPAGAVLDVKLQNKLMDSLYDIIQAGLRQGDVFARFSASQYVLMLPSLTFENCRMVMDRIVRRFSQAHRNRDVSIYFKIQPLDPIGI